MMGGTPPPWITQHLLQFLLNTPTSLDYPIREGTSQDNPLQDPTDQHPGNRPLRHFLLHLRHKYQILIWKDSDIRTQGTQMLVNFLDQEL